MNKIMEVLLKWSGFGWIWNKIDGSKTKIGAGVVILSGLAQVLNEVIATKDMAGIIELLKHLPQDQGALAIGAGLGMLGVGHKIEKQNAEEPK